MTYKDKEQITKDLRPINRAATDYEALEALVAFDDARERRPEERVTSERFRSLGGRRRPVWFYATW